MFDFLKNLFREYPKLGAKINVPDNRDIQLVSVQKPVDLPIEYFTDLSKIPVQDQEDLESCVGQAEGTIIAFLDYLENAHFDVSRRYIYAKCKELDGLGEGGTFPRIGASVIKNKGVPSVLIVPDDNKLAYNAYIDVPDTELLLKDAKTRKATYAFPKTDSHSLKQAILQNKLVSITIPIDWRALKTSGILTKPNPLRIVGYHRIVLWGFSGDYFYGRNSWGKKWGLNGDLKFKFEDYENFLYDPIVYVDVPNEILKEAEAQKYIFTRPLKVGSTGPDVVKLQERLKSYGYFIYPGVTQYYGLMTSSAVRKYQISVGLPADGVFGPKTMAKMNGIKMTLEDAIIQIESQGNIHAIGDKHLKDWAYGCMQIRKPCITDVNKKLGTNYKAEDMLGNKELSLMVFREYQKLYNPNGSDEEKARTWNGGPGWRRKPSLTDGYWSKVKSLLN